jgi:hypothetical protein
MKKSEWSGQIISIQPRIRLSRSFDERFHSYLGYCLHIEGKIGDDERIFSVGIGKVTQKKHQFRVGDKVSGVAVPVADHRLEAVEFYRASKLKLKERFEATVKNSPPWHGVPPDLETYRWRGHRRLSVRTYKIKCTSCIWGCKMPVEMIIDPWDPTYRYRYETFCYGPKSCEYYKSGPERVVPGRKGMKWVEEDWIDEQETEHRAMDE